VNVVGFTPVSNFDSRVKTVAPNGCKVGQTQSCYNLVLRFFFFVGRMVVVAKVFLSVKVGVKSHGFARLVDQEFGSDGGAISAGCPYLRSLLEDVQ
jgi:hypothetical protein